MARAVTSLKDEEIKNIVLDALGKIRNQQCIDAFCKVWADKRERDLTNLLIKKGWAASRPIDMRVITALKTKQLQVVTKGGKEIVEPLLKAFQDRDSEIANRASECAISLTNPEAIDYICQKWVRNRDKLFKQLVCKGKYIARNPIELRVLTALKIDNLEVLNDYGKEIIEPLLNAIQDRDSEIANRARECAISLTNPHAIDYICQKWAETRDKLLEQLVCKGKYIAQKPIELRVLTALKVTKLEVVQDGGKEIVDPLLKASKDKDAEIANRANECAISLTNTEAIDYICQKWAETRDEFLEQLICQENYIVQNPIELRVLTALKVAKLEDIRDLGKEIVEPLLKALKDKDSEIANRANECLLSLSNSDAVDYICSLAIEQNHQVAHQIALTAQYLPKDPIQKSLFYFLTEQWQKYESLDFDQNLLQKAHELAHEQLRKRIAGLKQKSSPNKP